MIKIWQSYSCNNSSAYRLVATFADSAAASAAARELEALFDEHATEVDARPDYRDEPSEATRAFGERYGFEWSDLMYWGTGGLVGDTPNLYVEDRVLVVVHTYCGGGLGDGIVTFVEKLGATTKIDETSDVVVSLMFRAPVGTIEHLDDELATMFAQRTDEDTSVSPLRAPWPLEEEAFGDFTYFRDAGTVGLRFPLDARDLDNLKGWLRTRGIDKPVLRIEDDLVDFEAIRKARCAACGGALEYQHPGLHDIETPQLLCRPCGGFYEVATFR